jgi:hypothetical protein
MFQKDRDWFVLDSAVQFFKKRGNDEKSDFY